MEFYYRGRTQNGAKVRGIIFSANNEQAAQQLRAQGYFVTALNQRGLSVFNLFRHPTTKDLALFCRQLATMLKAGLSLLSALTVLEKQHHNHGFRRVIGAVKSDLATGSQLKQALAKYPQCFPIPLVYMVEAGESGGILDTILFRMAEYYERNYTLQQKIKEAITYPIAVMLVAVCTLFLLLAFVFPAFEYLFTNAGLILPWPTRVLLAFGNLMADYWFALLLGLTMICIILYYLAGTGKGKVYCHQLCLHLPLIGSAVRKTVIARFCRTLGIMLEGGVPLLAALEIVKNTSGNMIFSQSIGNLQMGIKKGRNITNVLAENNIFPEMMVHMIRVGEETGTIALMLIQVADYYEEEVSYFFKQFSTLLEPILILLVAGVVGFIVIGIILPLLDVISVIE
ncbi:MAG: type II secretion system F family protein [bacterium]|jgi:type IV pilus assembly protein PilC